MFLQRWEYQHKIWATRGKSVFIWEAGWDNNCNSVRLPPVFVFLASPSILLVFFCVFCPTLPQLCTLLGSFSFSWFPFPGSLVTPCNPFPWFWVSLSSFLLLSPLLEPSLLFFFVVCQVPAGGRSCNITKKKGRAIWEQFYFQLFQESGDFAWSSVRCCLYLCWRQCMIDPKEPVLLIALKNMCQKRKKKKLRRQ